MKTLRELTDYSDVDLVIYHANCTDGFAAAWAVWSKRGEKADYISANYGDEPPDVEGRHVLIVDFSYKRDVLLEMKSKAASLYVLDHHKTAEKELEGLDFCLFDMDRSGAGMAWDELHQSAREGFIDYIEDRDLWRFNLPGSRAVNTYLSCQTKSFKTFNLLCKQNVIKAEDCGKSILQYRDHQIEQQILHARLIKFHGHKTALLNTSVNTSEVLDKCCEALQCPVALGWYQTASGAFKYSLRSIGEVDVSELAKKYGGGGHKRAAGFVLNYIL